MEAEFRKKVKAVQNVAFEEKAKLRDKLNMKLLQNLEACKAHGGPLMEKDADKLSSLTYEQLVNEVGYLKKTIAPQLRFKRKVDKKFVKYSAAQLIQQIKDVIKPRNDTSKDIDDLIEDAMYNSDDTTRADDEESESILPGTHGWWSGPFEEVVVGVLLDSSTLQKYKKKRLGYIPDGMPEDLSGLRLSQIFGDKDFHYIEKGSNIYLLLH